jgi:parvulin-like peptidyl-prolyl isomerase
MRTAILLLTCTAGLAGAAGGAVVIDRIAVVVGRSVIKTSDIDRALRLTEFLNRQPLNLSAQARRQAAERLIDQQIIRTELATGGYSRATDADADAMLSGIERDRFGSVEARLDAELERYGLTKNDLHSELLWQLTVLRFIQQRFQPGVVVSDEEVQAYYDQHLADLQRQNPRDSTFATLEPKIRDLLTGETVNKDFEAWLTRARQDTHVEYKPGAFQ